MAAKKKTNKILIIAAVAVGAFIIYKYVLSPSVPAGGALTSAGNVIRAGLLNLVTEDPKFASLVNSLSDSQASALQAWYYSGSPDSGLQDPVLGPVLTAFKNAGNYFFK